MSKPNPDRIRSITATDAWSMAQDGTVKILDLRTRAERRRYGWPPGARKVSLSIHAWRPRGKDTVYLCQHANRSKMTGRNGAGEVEGGWQGWVAAELPIEGRRTFSPRGAGGRAGEPGDRR